MKKVRVRFAPSPTGPLHIGGVRTALYNYLFAKQNNGTFILRIEDTDQTRYVPGAEAYIIESLRWCGLEIDEGPEQGGDYGPYRQSDRKHLYGEYTKRLVDSGHAYYAFDTSEELAARRAEAEANKQNFRYDASVRMEMRNSLSLPTEEVEALLASDTPFTIRLKVPEDEIIPIEDLIRGKVEFRSSELDDKVLLKADGMPTYHMANIVDDYLMKISHVIRGEEWLSSTAHHVLLYRFLGIADAMPKFAHLPLILKPTGKGKLSKRDGAKLGIPVFPMSWEGDKPEDSFKGFNDFGFIPAAVINFLAFLGWNPGTEQEIFSLEGLVEAFAIEKIGKSGARFDFDKARWFNQQYIMASSDEALAKLVRPLLKDKGIEVEESLLVAFCGLMKERVQLLTDFYDKGYYFFEPVKEYERKPVKKKWKPERVPVFQDYLNRLDAAETFEAEPLETMTKAFMEENSWGFGDLFPILRIALSGTTKGPGVFEMMELFGKTKTIDRMRSAFDAFEKGI